MLLFRVSNQRPAESQADSLPLYHRDHTITFGNNHFKLKVVYWTFLLNGRRRYLPESPDYFYCICLVDDNVAYSIFVIFHQRFFLANKRSRNTIVQRTSYSAISRRGRRQTDIYEVIHPFYLRFSATDLMSAILSLLEFSECFKDIQNKLKYCPNVTWIRSYSVSRLKPRP